MLGMSIFRRKARQFHYEPRHYDAQKEAREERKRLILGENYQESYSDKEYVPGKFIQRARLNRMKGEVSTSDKSRNVFIRLIIFIVLLLFAAYYIVSFDGFAAMLGL